MEGSEAVLETRGWSTPNHGCHPRKPSWTAWPRLQLSAETKAKGFICFASRTTTAIAAFTTRGGHLRPGSKLRVSFGRVEKHPFLGHAAAQVGRVESFENSFCCDLSQRSWKMSYRKIRRLGQEVGNLDSAATFAAAALSCFPSFYNKLTSGSAAAAAAA